MLEADDVAHVRQSWDARYSHAELRQMTLSNSWVVLWNAKSGEYVVAGPWRHRRDILEISEIAATGSAIELVQALTGELANRGVHLVVVPERDERRKHQFYSSVGFEPVEEIIVYELHGLRPPVHRPLALHFEKVDINNEQQMQALLELDHRAFPWLWWNSPEEFDNYFHADGVTVELLQDETGRAIAYVGYTKLRGWGHLDRIAVDPDIQGQGLGRRSLQYAVAQLVALGSRRVGLSTQSDNRVSRALYESFGFRRNRGHDYQLYGHWIGERRPVV